MGCEEFVALGAGFPDKRVGFPESANEFRVLHLALPSHSFITRMHRFELLLLSNQFQPRIVDRRGKLDPDQRESNPSFDLVMAEFVECIAESHRTAEANGADECLTLPAIVHKRSGNRILFFEPARTHHSLGSNRVGRDERRAHREESDILGVEEGMHFQLRR
jgi:hypothetical protein